MPGETTPETPKYRDSPEFTERLCGPTCATGRNGSRRARIRAAPKNPQTKQALYHFAKDRLRRLVQKTKGRRQLVDGLRLPRGDVIADERDRRSQSECEVA